MSVQQGNPRYANPSADADVDASRNSTETNPLSTGLKEALPSTPQEWGSLRMGVPKADVAFGLPVQKAPANAGDPGGNDGGVNKGFSKSSGIGNDVMAKPL